MTDLQSSVQMVLLEEKFFEPIPLFLMDYFKMCT